MVKNLKLKWLAGATLLVRGAQVGLVLMATLVATPASAAGAAGIVSGGSFNCALTTAGGVQCWGSSGNGQLGNGTFGSSSKPVDVIGLASGVGGIAANAANACALSTTGAVKCWGSNSSGQLGNGTTTSGAVTGVNKPVDVLGLSGVASVSVGTSVTCAVLSSGGVTCWGQLYNQVATPWATSVPGISNAIGIAAGSHVCVVLGTRGIQCFGYGTSGQLGDGLGTSNNFRVDVKDISDAASVVVGQTHTCYKSTAGAVKCWGSNYFGQIGNGSSVNVLVPTVVSGLGSGVVSLSAGANHNCAVLVTGEVKCWGLNSAGQLGTGDKVNRNVPTAVIGLAGAASAVSAGSGGSCAIINFNLQCWGSNNVGQLGAGDLLAYPFPVSVIGYAGVAPSMTPTPISPVTSNTPVYTWKPILGATSYRLNVNGVITTYTATQVGCDGAFGLCTITGTSLTAGSYTWSVQGFNSFGNGPWSAGTTFRL